MKISQIRFLDFLILLIWSCMVTGSIFTISDLFMDCLLYPKWVVFEGFCFVGIVLLPFVLFSNNPIQWRLLYKNVCLVTNSLILIETILSLSQKFFKYGFFSYYAIGTFDNVAGLTACIVVCFPLGWLFYKEYGKIEKAIFCLSKSLGLCTVIAYESRIGVVCIVFLLLYYMIREKKAPIVYSFLFLVMALPAASVFLKIQSTKGRWFILSNAFRMINEKPLFGWGTDGFKRNYMNIQANFFSENPDSHYLAVADNIHHPLNEYIHFVVNYGVLCLLFVGTVFAFVCYYYHMHKTLWGVEGELVFVGVGLLSFFSYPLAYPMTWLILTVAFLLLFNAKIKTFFLKKPFKKTYLVVVLCSVLAFFPCKKEILSQMQWKRVSLKASINPSKELLHTYKELLHSRRDDCRFLYDFAIKEYDVGHYNTALSYAKEAACLMSDYDIQLLLADIYKSLHKDSSAVANYLIAHNMCPGRLAPYYEIYEIYSDKNDTTACLYWHDIISKMYIKQKNYLVESMLNEIEIDIKRFKQPNY